MRYRRVIIVAAVLGVSAFATRVGGQDAARLRQLPFEKKIETRIGHFESGGKPLVELVLDLAYQYKLPMGLEYVDQAAATAPSLRLHGMGPLRNSG